MLVIAAIGGAIDWKAGERGLNFGGIISVVAFGGALWVNLSTAAKRPEEQWYRGRAAAESIKTLAWKYAVGGSPFLLSLAGSEHLYIVRLRELIREFRDLEFGLVGQIDQITPAMRSLRETSLDERKEAYLIGRIDDQSTWYSSKARASSERGRIWAAIASAATLLGLIAGIFRISGTLGIDYLGVLAAIAAGANAWGQMRQHRTLATSYAVAAQELGLARAAVSSVSSEDEWSRVVSDAEDAISREHTLWLARRSLAGSS
jgi:hypothetical protein